MDTLHRAAGVALFLAAGLAACSNDSNGGGPADLPAATVATGTGNLATVTAALTAFKTTLGGANNNATPGTQAGGFRAINWDAVGAPVLDTDTLPAATFSNRGLLMQTDGSGFRVDDSSFKQIPNVDPVNFPAFSGTKLFASVGSTKMDALFNVPGHLATPAAVRAFGVVFVDNEIAGSATIEAFDGEGRSLGKFSAPVTGSGQFSFVGVTFDSAVVARVRITSGTNALGTAAEAPGTGVDLVVMDDFVFGEPQASF